ncbi:helix-turn-helix transcriptional regulator [Planctomycetota bacterium]
MHSKAIAFLSDNGLSALPVCGRSMHPLLPEGSTVAVCPGRPRLGDIAVFCRGSDLIIHRVVFKWNGRLITMGDNSPVPDSPVRTENIIGTVKGVPRSFLLTFKGMLKTAWFRFKAAAKKRG